MIARDEKNKEEKGAKEIIQIRTEDTILNVFATNEKTIDKSCPLSLEQILKADGKNPLKTPLKTEIWQFKLTIDKMMEIADELKKVDMNYKKLLAELMKIKKNEPKQRIYLRVLTTKDGEILRTIRKFF